MKKALVAIFGIFAFCELLVAASTVQPQGLGKASIRMVQFPSTSQITVSTQVPVSPTATNMVLASTGGTVMFAVGSAYPAISTSTAKNGQFLILSSTCTTNNVYISTSPLTAVLGDDPILVITSTRSPVALIYNSTLSAWLEVGKQ